MPKLQDTRKAIKINLPSNPEVEITLKDGLLAGDVQEVEKIQGGAEQSFMMIVKMIESWNYTEDNGDTTPITIENIKKLNMKDIDFILKQVSFVKDFLAQRGKQNN